VQILAQKLVPQHLISRLAGKLAQCRVTWLKDFLIRLFISHFKVDLSEAQQEDYRSYEHFNAFFTRRLKPGLRPMPDDPKAIACPVDGVISELGVIKEQQVFQAKGHHYDLTTLLGGHESLAKKFYHGAFFTAYLSPKDYHRVHMPVRGTLIKMIHVPGSLFSVNPHTVSGVPNLFARNERVVCYFETEQGPMAIIMVAAIIVAGIVTPWHGRITPPTRNKIQEWDYSDKPIQLNQGDEMGYFEVGSTAIVLFGENSIQWESSLNSGGCISLGQSIALTL